MTAAGIGVRRMGPQDLEAVAALERACFSQPWSELGLAQELYNELAQFYVAYEEKSGTLCGYAGMHAVAGEGYVDNIAVGRAFRRRGVGTLLTATLLERGWQLGLCLVTLEVRASNAPAIGLYRALGFEEIGRRPRFYQLPEEDALIMTRYFSEGKGENHENSGN